MFTRNNSFEIGNVHRPSQFSPMIPVSCAIQKQFATVYFRYIMHDYVSKDEREIMRLSSDFFTKWRTCVDTHLPKLWKIVVCPVLKYLLSFTDWQVRKWLQEWKAAGKSMGPSQSQGSNPALEKVQKPRSHNKIQMSNIIDLTYPRVWFNCYSFQPNTRGCVQTKD